MQKEITKSVMEKIEEEHIAPKPKWHFLILEYGIWSFAAVAFIIGSLAFSVILYLLKNEDWLIYREMKDGFPQSIILALPYFWIILMGVFALVAYYNIKNTKSGYRYRFVFIFMLSVVLSALGGYVLEKGSVGEFIDFSLRKRLPPYEAFLDPRRSLWSSPDAGRLAGEIIDFDEGKIFLIRDFHNATWTIDAFDARLSPRFELGEDEFVRVAGQKTGQFNFKASIIAPLRPPRLAPPTGCPHNMHIKLKYMMLQGDLKSMPVPSCQQALTGESD